MKYTKISQSYHKIKICETKRKKDYCYAGGFWHTGGATETQYHTENHREKINKNLVYNQKRK